MRTEVITSAQNPRIKELILLQEKSRARRENGLFVVEGRRELSHCLEVVSNQEAFSSALRSLDGTPAVSWSKRVVR